MPLRLTLPFAFAAALLASCGERAALVEIEVGAQGDALCVWAWGDGERVFAETYPAAPGQDRPASGSLTFVAGARVADEARIGARVLRGGAIVGEGRVRVRFEGALVQARLEVARCTEHGAAPPLALVPLGALPSARGVEAADLDGDGADELVIASGGALHVLRAGELVTAPLEGELALVAAGDANGDCAVDLVAASGEEVRVVTSPGAAPDVGEPVAAGARDAAFGSFTAAQGPALALATAAGLVVAPLRGAPTTIEGEVASVAAADLDGDGFDDVLAGGPAGTRYFLGGASGLREVPAGLPPRVARASGPIVLGDFDGNGRLDLAAADSTALRVALDRGDGLLEERGGASPLTLGAPIAVLRAGDVDGDCADEIVAIAEDGSALVARLDGGRPAAVAGAWPEVVDAAVGDFDGDGARELAWLTSSGEVQAWRP